jgi:hypothetical protein
MKTKLAYSKIPDTLNCPLKQCVAFEKHDGTNLHVIWHSGIGWYAFGTRRDVFDLDEYGIESFNQAHPELKGWLSSFDPDHAIQHVLETNYKTKDQEVSVFVEYVGANSFAGSHQPKDKMQCILIDVEVDGKFVPPEQLIKDFGHCNLAKVVFQGKFTGQIFVDVRKGKYDVKEGVVVKGVVGSQVYMCKIKTEAYLDKLKAHFKDSWRDYWE